MAGTGWFAVSRLVRAETLALREREFIVAARALGASPVRILVRHVLPNVAAPALVAATLGVANVILLEAGLSYLGIGVRPPTASWGTIIQDGAERVSDLWWLTLFPGLAILVTVFACNALGDALRDAFDPRQLPRGTDATFFKEA
jgi:peptide/nickel transport system permease protein